MARRIIATLMLTAAALLCTGCARNIVTDSARANLADFVVEVFSISLDDALFPRN
ncbi:MAG: hypothetical protein IIB55_09960 [Planctomycetes bacterium]|nr:hypothetical protein [Planctomycetota bacterium]